MKSKTWAVRAGFLAVLAALVVVSSGRIDFSTDITNFMPDGRSQELAVLARHLARSDLARTMILTVGTTAGTRNDARIARAITELRQALAADPEIEWLRSGPEERDIEDMWKVAFAHRFGLVSLDPEQEIPRLTSDDALAEAAVRARQALASPAAALVKRTLPADPLGFSAAVLDRIRDETPLLEVHDGTFFSRDGWGVLLLATRSSAFVAARQAPVLDDIRARFAEVRAREGNDLVLEESGANRFAVAAESTMMHDMRGIVLVSLVGIGFLVFGYFRSPSRFAVAMLPSIAGIVGGVAAGLAVFGHLDGITLAFGTSLVGVTVDYPIHLLNYFRMIGGSRRRAVRVLVAPLGMGALTTVASFAGLCFTSFPGFREIGFIAVSGVTIALFVTLVVLPWFVDATDVRTSADPGATARVLGRAVDALVARRALLAAIPIVVVAIGAVLLPRLRWDDDLSSLASIDPSLQDEEKRVHARVAAFEVGRVAVVMADDVEAALERTEEITRRMERLRASGAIGGYRSVSSLVRSIDLQKRNLAALRAAPDLANRVRDQFSKAGFKADAFSAFEHDLAEGTPPITPADLAGTALEQLVQPLLLTVDGRTVTLTQISELHDEAAVRSAVEGVPGAHYFVQRDFVNELYSGFRNTTLAQLFIGGVFVIATLGVRYRRWRPSLAAFLPSALVPVLVLSGLAAAGQPLNLLHVISLIMVAGMGVDYGIFLVESVGDRAYFEATLVSLLLCCLTTIFGFAVIAVSHNPALRAMGLTLGSGVLLSLVLSPVCLLLVGDRRGDAAPDAPRT